MAGITAIYVSATTFTIVGDQTSVFNIGRRIRATCSDVYKYGTIESSTYTSLTTVVLTTASDDLNSGLTEVYYGIQADSTGSLPIHAHDTTEGGGGVLTFIGLSDTPAVYDDGKFLQSTSSGTDWVSGAGGTFVHSELSNLDYASAGHTGFAPTSHSHTESDISDLDKYTQSEVDTISGSLNTKIDGKADTIHTHDDRYYTESEVDTISGSLQTNIDGKSDTGHTHDDRYYTESEVDTISGTLQDDIDTHGHVSTEIIMSKINTPTYETLQDWLNNTQSAGRMSGGDTTPHIDAVTGVTVSGAGYGEFKVSGDQTAGYIVSEIIHITGSTNNNGYYTVASGVAYSGGTTTIPVEEAVGTVADGNITNGTVDVADGTAFIKQTDSDIGETVSFNIHATTNISLTDITTNYVYVDYNGGNPDIKVTTNEDSIEKNRQFPLSMVYKNNGRVWVCACGLYLPNRTRLDHDRILALRGYDRASGGEISEYGTRNIQSTAGEFYRGTTQIDTTAKTSVDGKLTTVYYDGAEWVWTEDLTQIDNTYYNDIATGLVELGVSKYAVHWVCIDYLSNLYVVYGRGSYSLSEAQLAGVPSLMPVVAYEFGIIAAKVIIQKTASSFTELLSAYTQVIPSATPAVHNDLSGLNDGDYKHLTAANHTDLTDSGDCSIHKHDDRYYTESEVDALIPDTLLELSDTPSEYDDNKYLRSTTSGTVWTTVSGGTGISDHSELSNLDYALAGHTGFSPTSHSHTESDISDLDKYTQIEVDTISGALNTKINGKSDTGHTHDDRYYTEGEVDTISGSLSLEIDSDIATHTSNVDAHHSESHTVVSHSDTTATGANLNELVGAGDTTLHKHGGQYYTENEVDTISGSLNTKIDGKIANIVEDTTPQLGGTLEINENTMLVDAILTSDHTWTGPTQTITVGENLAIFETAYLKSDGKYWRIDADAEATAKGKIVMATTAISADATGVVLLPGEFSFIRDDSTAEWTVTNAGDTMYLSTISGSLINDISGYTTGDIGRVAGYMETATILNFIVDKTWIKI